MPPLAVVFRRLFLITLLVLPQIYWLGKAWRFGGRRAWVLRWLTRFFVIAATSAIAAVLYDRIFAKVLTEAISHQVAPLVQLWIFSSTFAFFLTKALHALVWCWSRLTSLVSKASQLPVHDTSRRKLLRQTASIFGGAPFAFSIYGYAHERLRFVVEPVDVSIAGLPAALDGLRIVQLSDIHAGDFMPVQEIRRAVSMANELQSHLSVITGDFVTSWGDPLSECIHELSLLRAPLGIFGCNGNHEIYAGAEDEAEALFKANGMRLLRHMATQIAWNGSSLNLIGIDYQHNIPITGRTMPTLDGADCLVRADMPNILLSHNPNTFPSAAAAGVELSLAGHTHGGQVNVEILHRSLNPARFVTQFIAGPYRMPLRNNRGQACLYVNRGLGTLGFPARIASRPEITLLTLRSGSSN